MSADTRSVWWDGVERPQFEPLRQDRATDVLIVGGGIAGILCAYLLKEAGVDSILVEANRICGGITKNTTAKITFQHGLIYDKMLRTVGLERTQMYLEANRRALERYRELAEKFPCDMEERDNFVYSTDEKKLTQIVKEADALEKIGVPARIVPELPLPFSIAGAVGVERQAQFHPLKFLLAVAKGLTIYEHTKVWELKPHEAVTEGGTIRAQAIIIATHFPLLNKHGSYFMKLYQHRSYVLALRNAESVPGMYVDESQMGLSFRMRGDLLLLGGGGHRTGKKGGGWHELERCAKRWYPAASEVCRWATQDCMTLDGIPYIGPYSRRTEGLYVATGFNKWGMTSAMAAAAILCDMVRGKENPCAPVFSPSRSMMRTQLVINGAESLLGILTPTTPRCPHMGCALKYNREEHTWDCPCHGSRFEENGQLIDNPATDDRRVR